MKTNAHSNVHTVAYACLGFPVSASVSLWLQSPSQLSTFLSQVPVITIFTAIPSSQVPAFTIFTPKKFSRSILPSFTSFPPVKIPRSVNKSTQVPAISDFFHQNPDSCTANLLFTPSDLAAPIFSFQPSTLNPVPSLHLRRKYLISSFFFVTKRSKTEAFQSTFAPFGPNHTSNCSAGIGHLVLVIPLSFVPLSFVIRRATLPSFSLAPHRAAPHLVGGWRASTSITNRPRRFCLKCRKPWRRTCANNSAALPRSIRKDLPLAKRSRNRGSSSLRSSMQSRPRTSSSPAAAPKRSTLPSKEWPSRTSAADATSSIPPRNNPPSSHPFSGSNRSVSRPRK